MGAPEPGPGDRAKSPSGARTPRAPGTSDTSGASGSGRHAGSAQWAADAVQRHADALWRYAILRVKNADLAEELVQEALVAALSSSAGPSASASLVPDGRGITTASAPTAAFEGRSADSTWLIAILRNKIADHYRRVARERSGGGAEPPPPPAGAPGSIDGLFTDKGMWRSEAFRRAGEGRGDPRGFSDREEFLADLHACAANLPEGVWDAFVMREALGVESEAICQQLRITPTNLWQRLHRARAALRECLTGKGWWKGPGGTGSSGKDTRAKGK